MMTRREVSSVLLLFLFLATWTRAVTVTTDRFECFGPNATFASEPLTVTGASFIIIEDCTLSSVTFGFSSAIPTTNISWTVRSSTFFDALTLAHVQVAAPGASINFMNNTFFKPLTITGVTFVGGFANVTLESNTFVSGLVVTQATLSNAALLSLVSNVWDAPSPSDATPRIQVTLSTFQNGSQVSFVGNRIALARTQSTINFNSNLFGLGSTAEFHGNEFVCNVTVGCSVDTITISGGTSDASSGLVMQSSRFSGGFVNTTRFLVMSSSTMNLQRIEEPFNTSVAWILYYPGLLATGACGGDVVLAPLAMPTATIALMASYSCNATIVGATLAAVALTGVWQLSSIALVSSNINAISINGLFTNASVTVSDCVIQSGVSFVTLLATRSSFNFTHNRFPVVNFARSGASIVAVPFALLTHNSTLTLRHNYMGGSVATPTPWSLSCSTLILQDYSFLYFDHNDVVSACTTQSALLAYGALIGGASQSDGSSGAYFANNNFTACGSLQVVGLSILSAMQLLAFDTLPPTANPVLYTVFVKLPCLSSTESGININASFLLNRNLPNVDLTVVVPPACDVHLAGLTGYNSLTVTTLMTSVLLVSGRTVTMSSINGGPVTLQYLNMASSTVVMSDSNVSSITIQSATFVATNLWITSTVVQSTITASGIQVSNNSMLVLDNVTCPPTLANVYRFATRSVTFAFNSSLVLRRGTWFGSGAPTANTGLANTIELDMVSFSGWSELCVVDNAIATSAPTTSRITAIYMCPASALCFTDATSRAVVRGNRFALTPTFATAIDSGGVRFQGFDVGDSLPWNSIVAVNIPCGVKSLLRDRVFPNTTLNLYLPANCSGDVVIVNVTCTAINIQLDQVTLTPSMMSWVNVLIVNSTVLQTLQLGSALAIAKQSFILVAQCQLGFVSLQYVQFRENATVMVRNNTIGGSVSSRSLDMRSGSSLRVEGNAMPLQTATTSGRWSFYTSSLYDESSILMQQNTVTPPGSQVSITLNSGLQLLAGSVYCIAGNRFDCGPDPCLATQIGSGHFFDTSCNTDATSFFFNGSNYYHLASPPSSRPPFGSIPESQFNVVQSTDTSCFAVSGSGILRDWDAIAAAASLTPSSSPSDSMQATCRSDGGPTPVVVLPASWRLATSLLPPDAAGVLPNRGKTSRTVSLPTRRSVTTSKLHPASTVASPTTAVPSSGPPSTRGPSIIPVGTPTRSTNVTQLGTSLPPITSTPRHTRLDNSTAYRRTLTLTAATPAPHPTNASTRVAASRGLSGVLGSTVAEAVVASAYGNAVIASLLSPTSGSKPAVTARIATAATACVSSDSGQIQVPSWYVLIPGWEPNAASPATQLAASIVVNTVVVLLSVGIIAAVIATSGVPPPSERLNKSRDTPMHQALAVGLLGLGLMYLGPNIVNASATLLSFKDDISVAAANAAVFCALVCVAGVALLFLACWPTPTTPMNPSRLVGFRRVACHVLAVFYEGARDHERVVVRMHAFEDAAMAYVVSVMTGLHLGGLGACRAVLCVVVVVSLLHLMYLGVVRPYHATVEAVLAVCNASLIIGIALSSAGVAFTPNGDGIDADGSATMALTVLAYCQVAADSFYFVQTLVLLAFAVYDGCLRSVDPTAEGETVESAAPLLVLGPLHEVPSAVVDPSGGKDAPQQLENHEVSQRVSNPLTAAAHHA